MLSFLIELCTSDTTLLWTILVSDTSIALAYFAIPMTMAVVLRNHREDIPYPWLWTLFVAFIVACGLTHTAHVLSVAMGTRFLGLHATLGIVTMIASVGTAIAFMLILPQIKQLPSPTQQRIWLENAVAQRSREKDELIREINHRIGNQLQVLSSIVSIESRRAEGPETMAVLSRIREQLDSMASEHLKRSQHDYLESAAIQTEPLPPSGSTLPSTDGLGQVRPQSDNPTPSPV